MLSDPDTGWCASEDAGPLKGVDCEIPHRLERGTKHSITVWKPLPSKRVLKTLRGSRKGKSPKRIISASGGLGPLQMVSEPDTRQCVSKDAGPRRGVDCEIPRRLERGTKHSL